MTLLALRTMKQQVDQSVDNGVVSLNVQEEGNVENVEMPVGELHEGKMEDALA